MKKLLSKKISLFIFAIVLLGLLLFSIIGYFTFLDPEWQRYNLLGQIKNNHQLLYEYKIAHSTYPNSLDQSGAKEKYCIFLTCFNIQYKVASDGLSYTTAAKAGSPFVVFFNSKCPAIPSLENQKEASCAQIGLEENYSGTRTDWPIYRRDQKWFPVPSEWPELK